LFVIATSAKIITELLKHDRGGEEGEGEGERGNVGWGIFLSNANDFL
jgi:hypothetical protein